jgi:hypothetical protein
MSGHHRCSPFTYYWEKPGETSNGRKKTFRDLSQKGINGPSQEQSKQSKKQLIFKIIDIPRYSVLYYKNHP